MEMEHLEQFANQISGIGRQIRGQVKFALKNFFDRLLSVLGSERRLNEDEYVMKSCLKRLRRASTYRSRQHVVHERAERPPIDRLAVSAPRQDLRRPVLKS